MSLLFSARLLEVRARLRACRNRLYTIRAHGESSASRLTVPPQSSVSSTSYANSVSPTASGAARDKSVLSPPA
jgi:hypothetical protein